MYSKNELVIVNLIRETIRNNDFDSYCLLLKKHKNKITNSMLSTFISDALNPDLLLFDFVNEIYHDEKLLKELQNNSIEANKHFAYLCKNSKPEDVLNFIQNPFLGKLINFYEYDGDNFLRVLDNAINNKDYKALNYLLIEEDYQLSKKLTLILEIENKIDVAKIIRDRELYKKLHKETSVNTEFKKKTNKL